ncbi:MAG: four-carbon acid sugar kinase family protein [Vampirovibrio sp.]|nr:four-carbon acid sugar kinase family protein [Vampirovibrio sp.]
MKLAGLSSGIIADDLTGANDCILQFFLAGAGCRVLLGKEDDLAQEDIEQTQVWAINTDSRHLDPHDAVSKVRQAVSRLQTQYGVEHFYKKIDSTLRGHVAQECLAVLDELGWPCAVVVPAFPQQNRQTVGGYQLVQGIPVEQTEVARDPLFPLSQSHIPRMLADASSSDIVGHIELDTVLRGAGPILQALNQEIENGKKLVVVDACSNVDLDQIALVIEKIRKNVDVLPCGSAGLARALSRQWPSAKTDTAETDEKLEKPSLPGSPILVVSGSASVTTRQQLIQLMDNYSYYGKSSALEVSEISSECLLGFSPIEEEVQRLVTLLKDPENTTKHLYPTVVITSALKEDSLGRTLALADEHGIDPARVPTLVSETLTRITLAILKQVSVKLVIAGGETSAHICNAMELSALKIIDQVDPAIPLVYGTQKLTESDEDSDSLPSDIWMVTKSGNFGAPLALANIVKYLKQHEATPVPS